MCKRKWHIFNGIAIKEVQKVMNKFESLNLFRKISSTVIYLSKSCVNFDINKKKLVFSKDLAEKKNLKIKRKIIKNKICKIKKTYIYVHRHKSLNRSSISRRLFHIHILILCDYACVCVLPMFALKNLFALKLMNRL